MPSQITSPLNGPVGLGVKDLSGKRAQSLFRAMENGSVESFEDNVRESLEAKVLDTVSMRMLSLALLFETHSRVGLSSNWDSLVSPGLLP